PAPGVETPGYCQKSLRDQRIQTSYSAQNGDVPAVRENRRSKIVNQKSCVSPGFNRCNFFPFFANVSIAALWSILIGGKVSKCTPRTSLQFTKSAALTASSAPMVKLSPTHNAAHFNLVDSPINFMSSVSAVSPE